MTKAPSKDKVPAVIAIDGPSGSGKGTLSQLVARRLGWHLLDSGALYRILALQADRRGVPPTDVSRLAVLADSMKVRFDVVDEFEPAHVWLDGVEVTQEVRAEETGKKASVISAYPEVRAALMRLQKGFQTYPGLVADGRDMGTVVFPQASLKVYLEADAKVRAERRQKQLLARGINARISDLKDEIIARDARDSGRAASPMKPAEDAYIIDTTSLSIEDVFEKVWQMVKQKGIGS